MSHYEARLEHDLEQIHATLEAVGSRVETALHDAVHALLADDTAQAYDVILGDHPINRLVRRLDRMCHGFIALHLPSAGHLRLISAVIRTGIALERIGDYAVTICRESVRLSRVPQGVLAREVELMADESRQMLNQALTAFRDGNADVARATMVMADQVERAFDTVFEELVGENGDWATKEVFALLVIFHMLERVSDQAKNICEETVFAVTGQTKVPKVYRILFLDRDNAGLSQMAEAIARRNFSEGGVFGSAGAAAAETVDPSLLEFLTERGFDLTQARPKVVERLASELAGYHVMVSLDAPVKDYVGEVPFHTAALQWQLPGVGEAGADALEVAYRELGVRIRDLMHLLRGEGDA